jgi:hypothetical protein
MARVCVCMPDHIRSACVILAGGTLSMITKDSRTYRAGILRDHGIGGGRRGVVEPAVIMDPNR